MKRNPTAMSASSSDDDNDDDNDERESGQEDTKTQTPLSTLQVFNDPKTKTMEMNHFLTALELFYIYSVD